jgi:hypothetical protein
VSALASGTGSGATSSNSSAAVSAALNQLQPAYAGAAGASLMNLYGSFGASPQTSNSTLSGGR